MANIDEAALIEKLRRIEALHAGATTPGERDAAGAAKQRILARIAEFVSADPPIEYKFSIPDPWARQVFNALARRYGLKPYRHHGQHRQSVMLKVSKKFVDQTLWPEFTALNDELHKYLHQVTDRVIREGRCGIAARGASICVLALTLHVALRGLARGADARLVVLWSVESNIVTQVVEFVGEDDAMHTPLPILRPRRRGERPARLRGLLLGRLTGLEWFDEHPVAGRCDDISP